MEQQNAEQQAMGTLIAGEKNTVKVLSPGTVANMVSGFDILGFA